MYTEKGGEFQAFYLAEQCFFSGETEIPLKVTWITISVTNEPKVEESVMLPWLTSLLVFLPKTPNQSPGHQGKTRPW